MIQALSLAVAGSFYPVGLLFVLRYLAATRALFVASLFLIGGAIGCVAISILELVLLDSLPFDRSSDPVPNGAAYIVFGVGLLLIAAIYARKSKKPVVIEAAPVTHADPRPVTALFTGMLVYSPGLGLIAAVKALYDAKLSTEVLVLGLLACIVIILWMAEVPIIATAISPEGSGPFLRSAGTFVAVHGRIITIGIAVALGAYLVGDGVWIVAGN